MALPAPDLDDRRFQDFVDDAKRMVARRCPEWTDHNVHDPGVAVIEALATMADQLVYRLNRVPDRLHLRFLDLVGVRLHPPAAATVPLTFWLSAGQPEPVVVPAGTEVASRRAPSTEPVCFTTTRELTIVAVHALELRSVLADGTVREHRERLDDRGSGRRSQLFADCPAPDDALLIGLDRAAPGCAVAVRMDARIAGIGVDPRRPPLVWEAWTEAGWTRCTVDRDSTGGFNQPGEVVVHLSTEHTTSLVGGLHAGWLRARVAAPAPGATAYSSSPTVSSLDVAVVGGTVGAVHGTSVSGEELGVSEGVAGQRFSVRRAPVLSAARPVHVEVSSAAGWKGWELVGDFADSEADDRHAVLDPASGEVEFGPAVRLADGTVRQHGAVPAAGETVRVGPYLTGGGAAGNVAAGVLCVLRSSIPYVARVENRRPARGGRDAETLDEARSRGALVVRSRGRAVTAQDFEHVARQAAPGLARVLCVPASDGRAGDVRLLVVPSVGADAGRLPFESLQPSDEDLQAVAIAVDERRLVGTRVVVEPPRYQGVTVVARLQARPGAPIDAMRDEALAGLHRFLSPVAGGPDGAGWPFGRALRYGEVFALLQQVPGVELVEDLRLFPADPVTGARGEASTEVDVGAQGLVFSYDHQVRVSAP